MKRKLVVSILMLAFAMSACGEETGSDRGSVTDQQRTEPETVVDLPLETPTVEPTEAPEPTPEEITTEPVVYDGEICPLEINIESVYDGWNSDDYNYSAHITAPEITLETEGFDALAKAVNNYGMSMQKFATDNDLRDMTNMCKEMQAANPEPNDSVYMVTEYTTTVNRADSVVVSFLTQQYVDYAGAHPGSVFTTKTFDSVTGEALDIYDVVADDQIDGLPGLIADALLEKYEDVDFYEPENLENTIYNMLGMNSDLTYTLDYLGISFYFSAYELAPYAYGAQFVTFRYDDYPDLVNEKYQETTDNFIYPLNLYGENELPDGRHLDLSLVTFGEQYEDGCSLEMDLDGNHTSYEIYDAFDMTPWLLHCNDRDYMYLEWSTYGDYALLSIFDLNGSEAQFVQEYTAWFLGSPTDPENLKLYNRGDLLSTVGIYRYYTIGSDGVPEAKTDYHYVSSDLSLTLKKDLTCQCRSDFDAPEDYTEEKLAKGTKITFYAQNEDEGWVDFMLSDGRFVRIYVDASDYPRTVDGVDINDVFNDLFWAG